LPPGRDDADVRNCRGRRRRLRPPGPRGTWTVRRKHVRTAHFEPGQPDAGRDRARGEAGRPPCRCSKGAVMTTNDAVLVTGSAGFIGSALVKYLREIGRPVVGLDRAAQPAADSLRVDLTTITRADLPDPCPSTIIHLAALSKEPGFPWRDYFANNAEATRR